jgi:putative heme-binding domain-containing protein
MSIAMELLAHPDDEYLSFVFNETLNTLERRARTGSMLDRKNIAASLVAILNSGKIPAERQAAVIETICRRGTAKELAVIWEKAARADGYPPALRRRTLEWLADAATTRRAQPKVASGAVTRLLMDSDATLLPDAIRLAAAWKSRETADTLRELATNAQSSRAARDAAIDALGSLGDAESRKALRALSGPDQSTAIRFRAVTALVPGDLETAATAAAVALAASAENDDPAQLVQAFLVRKGGPERLAAALVKQKVPADAAKRILRAMYLAGRNDAALADVVSRFAGLDAAPRPPTPQEVASLGAEALAKGDPARGERVFRRSDLGCMKCHAINKAGGNIGPDLGPIGSSSPMDYIITSILDPSASIKEEYLTKVIATTAGQVVTGIVVERNKNLVVLKDATGKLVRIPSAEIDEEANGKSLMPEGVTRILTRPELLDLIRFVHDLGKPGPYAARPQHAVARWKVLREVPPSLAEGVPNLDLIRDAVLRSPPEAWDTVYSLVGGTLPVDDLRRPGKSDVLYLQTEIHVVQAGPIELRLDSAAPANLWIDDQAFEKPSSAVVTLAPGRHRVTVRIASGGSGASVRLDVRKPADSKAHVELVMGE